MHTWLFYRAGRSRSYIYKATPMLEVLLMYVVAAMYEDMPRYEAVPIFPAGYTCVMQLTLLKP